MLGFVNVFILVILQNILVQCLIPDLTVRKIDKKIIERKRLDTLEMCRIFNAETSRLNSLQRAQINARHYKTPRTPTNRRRVKRDLGDQAPPLKGHDEIKDQDALRVERVVDRLYDDLTENGHRVKYRHRVITKPTPRPKIAGIEDKEALNRSGRRYNFAPAVLLPPEPQDKQTVVIAPPEPVKSLILWAKKWKLGIVPYFIDPRTYDSQLAETIVSAFDYFEKATCIRLQRLREKPIDKLSLQDVEWIYISNPTGIRQCVHSNEKLPNKGVQMVVLGYDCMSLGEIIHEVMHILGFSHEHTRSDRDQHLSINWDNIKSGYKKYFQIRRTDELTALPYDYASVLHYPPRAFSRNGKITLSVANGVKIGQREGLSSTDIEKVSLIFGNECVERNKEYLLSTCPSVVREPKGHANTTKDDIKEYFKDKIWPYGMVTFKIRGPMEFSTDEKENINAVIKHIEKETCIKFEDVSGDDDDEGEQDNNAEGENENHNGQDDIGQDDNGQDDNGQDNNRYKKLHVLDEVDRENMILSQPEDENDDRQIGVYEDIPDDQRIQLSEDYVPNPVFYANENKKMARNRNASIKIKRSKQLSKKYRKKAKRVAVEKSKVSKARPKRSIKAVKVKSVNSLKSGRRHSASVLVLTRSAKPGCTCPPAGMGKPEHVIELNTDCFNSVNDLLHVFVHVLGLEHQHNMHDRDDYLHIVWDKLTPEVKKEMEQKLPPAASLGFPYDYQSVMHYPWLQIKNGVTHMMYPIWNDGWAMGHWQGLSFTDVQKLNLLYQEQCAERKKEESKDQAGNEGDNVDPGFRVKDTTTARAA